MAEKAFMEKEKIDLSLSIPRETQMLTVSPERLEVMLLPAGGGVTLHNVAGTRKRYLVGCIEILEDHSLPLTLRFFTKDGRERIHYRFVLLPRVRAKVCLDLTAIDMHNGVLEDRTPALLKAVIHGERTDMRDVVRVELGSKPIFHESRVVLEDFSLCDEKPTDFPLPQTPIVDRFGQWAGKDWPGKTHSEAELARGMRAQEGEAAYPVPTWDQFGGESGRQIAKPTGFFATCKTDDGRWHLVDPEGCDYFSAGVCVVRPGTACNYTHMEKTLEWLPTKDDPAYGGLLGEHSLKWLGGETIRSFDYGKANLIRVYGDRWEERWRELTYRTLMGCGVNSQGNGSNLDVGKTCIKLPYVIQLRRFPETQIKLVSDFPDVLSPEYAADSIACAEELRAYADDPFLIGYFLRNEPGFNFVENVCVAAEALRVPQMTYSRRGLIAFLTKRYKSVDALNKAWGADFASLTDLEKPIDRCVERYPLSRDDLKEYSRFLLGEYNRIPSEACRAADKHHLNLGMRWSNLQNPDTLAGWEHLDVFSFNCYALDPDRDMAFIQASGVDRPVLIGEFHAGALDRGLPSTGLKGVASQEERGVLWRYFMEKVAAHPLGVGAHWFQFSDEFVLGRFDGENYQIGLIDICMRPYREMTDAARETARVLYAVRNGETPPYARPPKAIPMIG